MTTQPTQQLTPAQELLKAKHGTPEEFAAACDRAFAGLMITADECEAGIAKYRCEWYEAGPEFLPDYIPPLGYCQVKEGVITNDCRRIFGKPINGFVGRLAEHHPDVIFIRRIPAAPVAETEITAHGRGMPRGNMSAFLDLDPAPAPEATPADHIGDTNEMVHDHVGDANEMIFTAEAGPLCVACGEERMKLDPAVASWNCHVGECENRIYYETAAQALADAPRLHARALAANGDITRGVASKAREEHFRDALVKMTERATALTAENTRLAGELKREKAKYERLSIRHLDFSAMVAKQIDENKAKFEAEIARLKAPVEAHEMLVKSVHNFLIAWPCDEDHGDPDKATEIPFELIDELKKWSNYGGIGGVN